MVDIRPKDLPSTSTVADSDRVLIDGATTRSAAVSDLLSNRSAYNLTSAGSIQFAAEDSTRGPFSIAVDDAGAGADPHIYMGYNVAPKALLINDLDRGLITGIESDYNDGSGNNKMEWYVQYQIADGFTTGSVTNYRRSIMIQYDKVTNLPTLLALSGGSVNGIGFYINDGTGTTEQSASLGKQVAEFQTNRFTIYTTPNGANPALNVDTTATTPVTGISISSRALTGGAHIDVISPGTNETLYIAAKGSSPISLNSGSIGGVLFPDGSVSAPGIAFESDQDCGLYRIGANDIAITVGGVKLAEYSSTTGVTLKKPTVVAPTLLNSWVDMAGSIQTSGYYQTPDGMVHLQGSIMSGTVGQPAFTLPAGLRPSKTQYFVAFNPSAGTPSFMIQVGNNGNVIPQSGVNSGCSLDSVHFLAQV